LVLVELSVVEQRYRVVLAVEAGATVSEIARQAGVSRQTVHSWLARYANHGLAGLVDRSKRPQSCPHQLPVELEAAICELRREHPRWGPRRLQHELGRSGRWPVVPARMTVYRVLVRHGLISPGSRRRRRGDYRRWEREAPMALWQLDIVGRVWLTGGTEAKVITGVDDHSRYCVIAQVVARATGRAACLAFAGALGRFGVPEEVLTDNGKQFTARFGQGGEVLFDRICRDNGITHRLTPPASPTTTGKVERFHQSLRRELLDGAVPFTDLATAQAAIDAWVVDYNTTRPHQALAMACPADRFAPASRADQELVGLRLPAILTLAPPAGAPTPGAPATGPGPPARPAAPAWTGQAVEFDRIVPASGNLGVAGKQFWLGDGIVESIRALRAVRSGAIEARTAAINQLKGLLVTAPARYVKTWIGCLWPRWLRPAPGSARTRPAWPIRSRPPRRRCGRSLAASISWTRSSAWPISGCQAGRPGRTQAVGAAGDRGRSCRAAAGHCRAASRAAAWRGRVRPPVRDRPDPGQLGQEPPPSAASWR
jgi:transposase InsO family protein